MHGGQALTDDHSADFAPEPQSPLKPPPASPLLPLMPPPIAAPALRSHVAAVHHARQRSANPAVDRFLISETWAMAAPILLVLFLLAAANRLGLHDARASAPYLRASAMTGLAVLIIANTRRLAGFEHAPGRAPGWRGAALGIAVGLPMLLYGAAMAILLACDRGHAGVYLGVLVIAGGVAAILLTNRLPALVVAQTGLWIGTAVSTGSFRIISMMSAGCLFGVWAAIRHARISRVSHEQQAQCDRALLRAEEILADYEQTGQGWFWETDRRGMLVYLSPTISQLLGARPDDGGEDGDEGEPALLNKPFTSLFSLDASAHEGERTLLFHLNSRSSFQELSVRAATADEERWWSINGRPIYDGYANFMGFRGSGSDLTERRRTEQNASQLAHYDSLTGLANRFQMSQTLEKILLAAHAAQRICSVFLLDLDRFKQVNDTMGHPAGDALLKQVAQRLLSAVGNQGRVGRLGGDEFQVILPGGNSSERLSDLASRIIEALSQPYSIEGHRVVIGASLGIAVSPGDGTTTEAIIRNADLALYAAKDRGRGCHHFYTANLHSDAEERRQLEQDLRDAIVSGGLELYYQPVIKIDSDMVSGFEALLRWNHPVTGQMSPTKFIPIAEDAGLIGPIGEWALRTACQDLATWPETVRVAVNVSALQFANPALPAIVTSALAFAQVAPDRLELEITESVFLNDEAGTEAMFTALKRVGVRLALDDFGTGYSSLGYLKKAPFDKIKIDQSFVRGATVAGSRNGAIIAAIVSLAEALGMETTAEGVETLDELDLMRQLGCSHIQGYIYSKPVDLRRATALVTGDLKVAADGPRSARARRRTMLRKVSLQIGNQAHQATVRNISETGALLEGRWRVAAGTECTLALGGGCIVHATVRWANDGQIGVEFRERLSFDGGGGMSVMHVGECRTKAVRLAG